PPRRAFPFTKYAAIATNKYIAQGPASVGNCRVQVGHLPRRVAGPSEEKGLRSVIEETAGRHAHYVARIIDARGNYVTAQISNAGNRTARLVGPVYEAV